MATWSEKVYRALEEKEIVGTQSESNSSQTAEPVKPATNGASAPCDILIQNVGSDDLWVTDGSTTASTTGLKLKPGQSIRYEDHVADDGDLQLYPDTSNGMTAELTFIS